MRAPLTVAALLVALAAGFAVGRVTAPPSLTATLFPANERPVITFKGGSISRAEVDRALAGQNPVVLARAATPDGRAELMDQLLRRELFAREALERKLVEDPVGRAGLLALLEQRLIAAEFDENPARKTFTDAELQALYQAHLGDYQRPEVRHLSHVLLADKATAAALKVELAGPAPPSFEKVASERSVDLQTNALGGTLGAMTREDLVRRFGAPLADAVWEGQVGTVLGPLQSPSGFHLVRLDGRFAALDMPFEQVKEQLKTRRWFEQRPKLLTAYLEELKAKAQPKVDEQALTEALTEAQSKK